MKKWSLFFIFLLPVFFHGPAQAYVPYGELCGGVNFLQTKTRHDIKLIENPGYIIGASIGIHACYGLRLEAEFAYRKNFLNKIRFLGLNFRRNGHFESFSYMGNMLWDFPLKCIFRPYIGGGIGYDFQQSVTRSVGLDGKKNKKDFAWQVMAGLKYEFLFLLNISLEYKYHQGCFSHINCHSLGLCLTGEFGL
jgi:opacity protein-like surface antigen